MPETSKLSETPEYLHQFLELTDAGRLSRNLRNMFLHYQEVIEDGFPCNMKDLRHDMINLFDLLDALEKENKA